MMPLLQRLCEELSQHQIYIKPYKTLTKKQAKALRDNYLRNIFPLVTPLAMDPAHPFPFVSNLSLNFTGGRAL